jgi:Tfp pilus assembly protein PilV
MKLNLLCPRRRQQGGVTLVEALVAVVIISLGFTSLCVGMSGGFAVTKHCRENLRATQIMLERLEGVRLYNWNQLCYSNMIPQNFTTHYYPFATNAESKGVTYAGKIQVTPPALNPWASYATSMRAVTVSVTWTNANGTPNPIVRTRTMTTYASRNGVQNYVFSN